VLLIVEPNRGGAVSLPRDPEVLSELGRDGRSALSRVRWPERSEPVRLRVSLAEQPVDVARAVERTRALQRLAHPGLAPVLETGVLPDGRFYALVADAPLLNDAPPASIEGVVAAGVTLAGALAALHQEGFTLGGQLSAREVLAGPRPSLDVSAAGLSMPGAGPEADVPALAQLLLQVGVAGADRGPFESTVRRTLQGAATARALEQALVELQGRWRARTAVSTPGQKAPGEEPDLSGTVLGQYQLERILGEGAMGRVYLARHQRIGRVAAVKVLKAEHAASAELVGRFIQEATAVNTIKNEHIVEVYDFGEEPLPDGGQRVFCVMELLEGRALSDAINDGPLPLHRVVRLVRQLSLALGAAHQVGVVHRDVKPENIFLHRRPGDPEFVKVLDFGVAKLLKPLGDIPRSGTQAGVVIGTPEYMAPEQALGAETDARIDLYAAGLVLYELLAGRQPFTADTFGKMVVQITTQPPPPLPACCPHGEAIPPGLAAVVKKALEKKADDRYATARDLADALAPFEQEGSAEPLEPELRQVLRPSPLPRVVAGVVALGVLAGLATFALSGREPAPEPAPPAPVVAPAPPPKPVMQAVPPLAEVSLSFASTPAGASVRRTDTAELLGTTPLTRRFAAQEQPLPVEFSLSGYRTQARAVVLSADAEVSVTLEALPRPVESAKDPKGVEKPKSPKKGTSRDGTVDPFAQ
jgi:serine/threonine-protein kinase